MGSLGAWLLALSWPIVARVLTSIGVGTVTYVGAQAALTSALNAAKSALAGLTADLANFLALAGFFEAMSIIAGGLISGLTWMVLKRFALKTTG